MAFVGAGGKTTALLLLVEQLAPGGGVIATTTTAMLLREIAAAGPLFRQAEEGWLAGLRTALARGRRAALAYSDGDQDKVAGVSPATVDALWASGVAGNVVVEADGSRGLPFKAFAPHEPQVPATATTVVVVAGLDALGVPLTDGCVHHADMLASTLEIPPGSEVTSRVLAGGLHAQVAQLQRTHAASRLVVLLNKADSPETETAGRDVARELRMASDGDRDGTRRQRSPERVVIGSLREGRYVSAGV